IMTNDPSLCCPNQFRTGRTVSCIPATLPSCPTASSTSSISSTSTTQSKTSTAISSSTSSTPSPNIQGINNNPSTSPLSTPSSSPLDQSALTLLCIFLFLLLSATLASIYTYFTKRHEEQQAMVPYRYKGWGMDLNGDPIALAQARAYEGGKRVVAGANFGGYLRGKRSREGVNAGAGGYGSLDGDGGRGRFVVASGAGVGVLPPE
ncbi:hypothetical protein HDU76_011083, partial [Blyttiomyces sp. JEL0837]